jgi:ribosomal protein S6--L-glutamate ligase
LGNEGSWYYQDLHRAAAILNHDIARLDFPHIASWVHAEETRLVSGEYSLASFDAVIVRTMPPGSLEQVVYRMDALAALEAAGVLVVNPAKAVECAVDKFLTTHRLQRAGLPVPRTVVCEDAEAAMTAFAELGGDVVVKPLFGSEGRGIVRVSDPDLAWRTFRALERLNAVLYLQEFIDHPGWDVRVMVLGGRILGAMRRVNPLDFRTNVSRRASIEPHLPTAMEEAWALAAASAVGAWFAGVDVLYNRAGLGYVIEVNAVPGWRAFAKATGKDIAVELVQKIEARIEEQKNGDVRRNTSRLSIIANDQGADAPRSP